MRTFLLACLCATLAFPVKAQPETELDSSATKRIRYTRLDQITEDKALLLSGGSASIAFRLVRLKNLSTGQTIEGVEVNIEKKKTERTGGSIATAAVGGLFGVSSKVTFRRIRNSGYILLRKRQLDEVVQFMNSVFGQLGKKQSKMSVWKISLQEGFELGMRYNPEEEKTNNPRRRPRWKFVVTTKNASYELPYKKGLNVIQQLSDWKKRIGTSK